MGGLADRLFREEFESQLLETVDGTDVATDRWSTAGKGKKKTNPAGEDATWWRREGPDMVQRWMDWRKQSGWKVWTAPDGTPAIELDIVADMPGVCSEPDIPLKMFVDRVMVTPAKQLCIVDLKAGARTPESDLQLGVYRYGIYRKYGVDVRLGAYWMARKGDMEPLEITRYTPELIETWFKRFRQATDDGIFLPHPTFMCRACPVRDYCVAFGGSKSHMDPDSPQWENK